MKIENFWDSVDKSGGPDACWPHKSSSAKNGDYGIVNIGGRMRSAHRIAFELATGEIPGKRKCCHSCDNPPCCNPAHLFAGTQQDNMTDAKVKGRLRWPATKHRGNITGIR